MTDETPICEACGGATYDPDESDIHYECMDCGYKRDLSDWSVDPGL